MASDELHEDVPQKFDEVSEEEVLANEGGSAQAEDGPAGFPGRWGGGADDTQHSGERFGDSYSGQPTDADEKAEELGERWGRGPDDSAERAEEFGETYAGDNQGGEA